MLAAIARAGKENKQWQQGQGRTRPYFVSRSAMAVVSRVSPALSAARQNSGYDCTWADSAWAGVHRDMGCLLSHVLLW